MSNNRTDSGPSSLPFLVVEYEDEAAAVGRNTNYQEALASVKRVFAALRNAKDENLAIRAHLEEVDKVLRIDGEIWSELLPRLTSVKVTLDGPAPSSKPEQLFKFTELEEEGKGGVTVHIHCRIGGNWNNPVSQIYATRISLDRTFKQLIDQVKQQESIAAERINFRYNNVASSYDAVLTQSGLRPNSVVEILTH